MGRTDEHTGAGARRAIRRAPLLLLLGLTPASLAAQPPAAAEIQQAIGALRLPTPAHAPAEIDRALAARDYPRAERLLADAVAEDPSSRELLLRIASVFLLDRKPLNAAIALKKAEALDPLDDHERLQLVLAYIALRRGDWARPELDRLTRSDPENPVYLYWLGRLDYDDGQYASAIERLQKVIQLSPGFVRAYDNLGLCYEALHRQDEALAQYREAVRLNRLEETPSSWPVLNLGILLRNGGILDEAEALFHEAVRYDPAFAPGLYQLGAVLEERGRLQEALTALRQAASADEEYAEPHYALARIYRQQGDTARANAALETFKRLRDAHREARR